MRSAPVRRSIRIRQRTRDQPIYYAVTQSIQRSLQDPEGTFDGSVVTFQQCLQKHERFRFRCGATEQGRMDHQHDLPRGVTCRCPRLQKCSIRVKRQVTPEPEIERFDSVTIPKIRRIEMHETGRIAHQHHLRWRAGFCEIRFGRQHGLLHCLQRPWRRKPADRCPHPSEGKSGDNTCRALSQFLENLTTVGSKDKCVGWIRVVHVQNWK